MFRRIFLKKKGNYFQIQTKKFNFVRFSNPKKMGALLNFSTEQTTSDQNKDQNDSNQKSRFNDLKQPESEQIWILLGRIKNMILVAGAFAGLSIYFYAKFIDWRRVPKSVERFEQGNFQVIDSTFISRTDAVLETILRNKNNHGFYYLICGENGIGKTTLLKSIVNQIILDKKTKTKGVLYCHLNSLSIEGIIADLAKTIGFFDDIDITQRSNEIANEILFQHPQQCVVLTKKNTVEFQF